jgi:anti-sigma regulatory factor (Ser/Thr protein kinase)
MTAAACAAGFRHEALFYRGGLNGFVAEVAPMVSETLSSGGSAVVAVPTDRVQRFRGLFGEHEHLTLIDMTGLGANPGRIIPAWREVADTAIQQGAPFLGIGEPVWVGRTADELVECHRHEALINVAFADDPYWRLVCPYDVDGLDPEVIEHARATHPATFDRRCGLSEAPVDALGVLAALERPLSQVPDHAATIPLEQGRLADVRDVARRHADVAGLSDERVGDLVLAVTEMAANSIRHGGTGTLAIWHREGRVICQTRDGGHIEDPMVGRRRPGVSHTSGRGMWIIQQLCDLVQLRSSPGGTTLRITVA